jgi:hypothetical protein
MPEIDIIDHCWSFDKSLGVNILNTINSFVLLPEHEIQSRVVASFLCQDTSVIDKGFILYCCGTTRSGKSTLAKISKKISNNLILAANSTVAAIRRKVSKVNSQDANFVLILDDWNEITFSNNQLYQFLKNSCDRDTALELLSSSLGDSEINEFSTFSTKVITSTFELWKNPDRYSELISRCLFIRTKAPEGEHFDIPQVENFGWKSIEYQHHACWDNKEARADYRSLYILTKKPAQFSLGAWERVKAPIICGTIQGVFESIDEGIELYTEYWHLMSKTLGSQVSLKAAIEDYLSEWNESRPELVNQLNAELLSKRLRNLIRHGFLPYNRLDNQVLATNMADLGFKAMIVNKIPKWIREEG